MRQNNRLKYYRRKIGLSQYQISKILGVPRSTYQNWERGVANPKLPDAIKLSKILEVPVEELFDFDSTKV